VSSRSVKEETWGAEGSSTWKLKSPVRMSSDEDEITSSRREVNSDMKVGLEEDGGRYILSKVYEVVAMEADRTLVGARVVKDKH